MANYLDPETEDRNPVVPQDSQSGDSSKSGLRRAWDAWSSRPENNAALMQFGIALMQPRAPGQSAIGQFGNALGEGAEASARNVAIQRAEEEATSKRALEEAKTEATTSQAGSARINAEAYARQTAAMTPGGKTGMQGVLRQQADFRRWAAKPDDAMALAMNNGVSTDPIVQALSKTMPHIKTKGDILADPRAKAMAQKIFTEQLTTEPDDQGNLAPAVAPQPAAPGVAAPMAPPAASTAPAAPIRRYNAQGKGVEWNGTQWVPIN